MRELANAMGRLEEFRLHPLGFYYLQDRVSQGITQRVHVWLPDGPDPLANDQHQHSYDIESFVVLGRLRSELFRYTPTADGANMEFVVSYEAGKSILRPTGTRGVLNVIASFETPERACYQLRAGVIHKVTVKVRPCITVLTTIERGISIYSYGLAEEDQPFTRRLPVPEEAASIDAVLKHALASLAAVPEGPGQF